MDLFIKRKSDGEIFKVRKYIKEEEPNEREHIWSNDWYGHHIIGSDCEWANDGTSEKDLRVCEVSGSVNWRGKLIAFMEGLEVENIDDFIVKAKIGDYRRLGEVMSKRIKELKHFR